MEEGAVEVESVDEAEGVALTFSASISEEGASKAACAMSESEVIIDSELMDGLAGEKIKVTLEGEPVGIELGAEEEAEALVGTAAAPREGAEGAVMEGRLGIDDIELDMLAMAGMEAEVEVLRAEAVEDEAMDDVMEVMEVIMDEDAIIEEEAIMDEDGIMDEDAIIDEEEAIDIDEGETSSMFMIESLSSTESDIDCKRSCEVAAGFQSG